MRLTSNILGEIGAANKLAAPSPFETDITIPAAIQPTIELRSNIRTYNPNGNDVQQGSFITEANFLVANAVLQSTNMVTIAPGIWELCFQGMYSSNYASAGGGFFVQINGFSLGTANLMKFFTEQAGATIMIERTLICSFDQQQLILATLGANGVGNSHRAHLSIVGHRKV